MSRATTLDEYRDTPQAEEMIEELGQSRVEAALADAELIDTAANYFASFHDGSVGFVLRLSDEPVLERIYEGEQPSVPSVSHTRHSRDRAAERGFYDREVIELAKDGVLGRDEDGIVAFNRLFDDTVIIPLGDNGNIKTVFSRQGRDGKLRLGGQPVDRPTRSYRERRADRNSKYKHLL